MKIKMLLLLFLSINTSLSSQKTHCRVVDRNAPERDTFAIIDKSPYRQNTRANLVFYKREINHTGCNENPYQTIVNENFNTNIDSTVFAINSSSPAPYDYYDPNPGVYRPLIYRDSNVIFKNGLAHLKITNDIIKHGYPSVDTIILSNNDTIFTPIEKYVEGYSAGRLITAETQFDDDWTVEDCGCYKFGKFSSRIKIPKTKNATFAYWFFGCGNEIDVFEFFNGTDCHIRSSIHQWNLITDDNDTHAEYGLNFDLGDLSEKFHVWTLEWTPYKIEWSVDGKVFRTFYKYYKEKVTFSGNQRKVCFIGLDGDDIPPGTSEVWEISGWNAFSSRPIDLILGPGLLDPANAELIVDWIKIEQKPNLTLTATNSNPCIGEEVTIIANHTDQIVDWKVSDNLEIITINENTITVKSDKNSSLGWVEAMVIGNNIEIPFGSFHSIGYSFYNENDDELHRVRNASYNCHDTKISVKKSIFVGSPFSPTLENNYAKCKNQFEIWDNNFPIQSEFASYNWNILSDDIFSLKTTENHLAVFPTFYNFDQTVPYELTISNNCGTVNILDSILILNCEEENNSPQYPLLLFPNPSSDFIQFKLLKTTEEEITPSNSPFSIINVPSGKTMVEGNLGKEFHTINISSWPPGNYSIVYFINQTTFSKSFSIIR